MPWHTPKYEGWPVILRNCGDELLMNWNRGRCLQTRSRKGWSHRCENGSSPTDRVQAYIDTMASARRTTTFYKEQ